MVDEKGNTEEVLAQKEAEIAELKEKLEKADGRVQNAQGKIHDWESEVGENRKAVAGAAQAVKALSEELIAANKDLAEARKVLGQAQGELAELKKQKGLATEDRSTQKPIEDEIREIESSLTEEDRKALDVAIAKTDPAIRAKIGLDDKTYLEFLKALRRNAKTAGFDLPRWRKTPAPSTEDSARMAETMDKLFKDKKTSAEYIPDGSSGGTPRQRVTPRPADKVPVATWVQG